MALARLTNHETNQAHGPGSRSRRLGEEAASEDALAPSHPRTERVEETDNATRVGRLPQGRGGSERARVRACRHDRHPRPQTCDEASARRCGRPARAASARKLSARKATTRIERRVQRLGVIWSLTSRRPYDPIRMSNHTSARRRRSYADWERRTRRSASSSLAGVLPRFVDARRGKSTADIVT